MVWALAPALLGSENVPVKREQKYKTAPGTMKKRELGHLMEAKHRGREDAIQAGDPAPAKAQMREWTGPETIPWVKPSGRGGGAGQRAEVPVAQAGTGQTPMPSCGI